jgi:hypothetical protein
MPESEYPDYYNESRNGVLMPRVFWVDAADAIGSIGLASEEGEEDLGGVTAETTPTMSHEHPIQIIHQDVQPATLHPIRKAALSSHQTVAITQTAPVQYWTDFFELPQLPSNQYLVSNGLKPTESRFKYWFEYDRFTSDKADESMLRTLVEETDSSVQLVRVISDVDTSISEFSISSSEYLKNCYPKSKLLCPVATDPHHAIHDHALPSLVNLAYWIHNEQSINEGEREGVFVLFPSSSRRTHGDDDRLHASALESIWIDSVSACGPQQGSQVSGVVLETPYLSIDGKSYYSPLHSATHGSMEPRARIRPIHRNIANPIPTTTKCDIIA